MKVALINLRSRTNKLNASRFHLKHLNFNYSVLNAVDGEYILNSVKNHSKDIESLIGIKGLKQTKKYFTFQV